MLLDVVCKDIAPRHGDEHEHNKRTGKEIGLGRVVSLSTKIEEEPIILRLTT
jgi:hypothetical protein